MLPDDLAFTVFVPSEKAFKRDLQLWANSSSAIPRSLLSVDVPLGKEVTFDSISGFKLYVSRESNGAIATNRVP
ncbi:hypothetical protein GIB67_019214 [Kingdonia uniflora]|uniref:FAS1 domain-containing protein n=1 Tax=Kingdonia uniflora TaxID=39325 RepID=A0A7J7MZT6_9MAGN|nr:hypothetical protein GIB67_019214 [Kingdonia uniflora]